MTKFDEIYLAALHSDENKLNTLKGTVALNDKGLSPIAQLAFENQHEAVELLIKYRFAINGAGVGYAMGSNHEKVEEFRKRGVPVGNFLVGYALAGNYEKVNEYYMHGFKVEKVWSDATMKQTRLNYIAMACAATNQHDKVEEYLQLGASKHFIGYGYAVADNEEKVKKYRDLGADVHNIASGFIQTSNHKKIETYCRQELGISRYKIAAMYAQWHYFTEAKDTLIAALIDEIKILRENNYIVNALLGSNERIKNLTGLMQELMVEPNHYLTLKELYAKYQLSDLLGEADNDALKQEFQKLLLDPNFLHMAHEKEVSIMENNQDNTNNSAENTLEDINEDVDYYPGYKTSGLRRRVIMQ